MTVWEKSRLDFLRQDVSFSDGAYSMYGAGWRAEDKEDLLDCYEMDEAEADKLCEFFHLLEKEEKESEADE